MEFKDILAISGMPGLYKYVAQSTRGIIVESLADGHRSMASATSRVSALSEISMFTEGEDIALADVFTRMYAHTEGKDAVDYLVERLLFYFLAAYRTVRNADSCIKKSEIVVNLSNCTNCRTWILACCFLINRNCRR